MSDRYELNHRLEPETPGGDLEVGFRAQVQDPAWMLGQQWRMGEHAGENAGSPVLVEAKVEESNIEGHSSAAYLDPANTPPEAIIEGEVDDWWTIGRRLQYGRKLWKKLEQVPGQAPPEELCCDSLPVPYQRLNNRQIPDGLKIYQQHVNLGLDEDLFEKVPRQYDAWEYQQFHYDDSFKAGGSELQVKRHTGGHVDWFSADADGVLPSATTQKDVRVYPSRLRYPGAPHPRWWQVENHQTDIGGYPPDQGHFATLLVIDLVMSHSDDWFTFPVQTRSGAVVSLKNVTVTDGFGRKYYPEAPNDWHLFKTKGLPENHLVVWPTITAPMQGEILEEVILGIDEDANRVWAIEQRIEGRATITPKVDKTINSATPEGEIPSSQDETAWRYRQSSEMPYYWHPYEITETNIGERLYVQGRLADYSSGEAVYRPEPVVRLLNDPVAPADQPPHYIVPAAIPPTGLRLQRRNKLGRRVDGKPVLWIQRERLPLLGPPISGLRFDVLEEKPL
ncbi:MAG: hypothetical protein RNU03_11210 [Candidatus Sedimenticola sp. (ex Thyasira tokunagai)]